MQIAPQTFFPAENLKFIGVEHQQQVVGSPHMHLSYLLALRVYRVYNLILTCGLNFVRDLVFINDDLVAERPS